MKSILNPIALISLLLAGSFISCNGQEKPSSEGIQWMSFEEAVAKSEKSPKKLFIDVYTQWCGWCKKMDKTTFTDPAVIQFMNEHYYAVKLDAETKDSIHFRDKVFNFIPEYKANELAISLLSGKMGFPSYVILDENFGMLMQPVQSYLEKDQLMPILTYYGENIFKQKTWEEFQAPSKDIK